VGGLALSTSNNAADASAGGAGGNKDGAAATDGGSAGSGAATEAGRHRGWGGRWAPPGRLIAIYARPSRQPGQELDLQQPIRSAFPGAQRAYSGRCAPRRGKPACESDGAVLAAYLVLAVKHLVIDDPGDESSPARSLIERG